MTKDEMTDKKDKITAKVISDIHAGKIGKVAPEQCVVVVVATCLDDLDYPLTAAELRAFFGCGNG